MEENRSRPQTGSSDHEDVGARMENAREEGLDTDSNSFAQDNFEDAASMARSHSGERSLTGRRSSTDSKTTLDKRDSDVYDVPPVPALPAEHMESNGQDSARDDNKVDDETGHKEEEEEDNASTTKSPPAKATSLLSSESMDEVNLDEEGKKSANHSRNSTLAEVPSKPVDHRDSNGSMHGLSGHVPTVQFPPPPPPPEKVELAPPPPPPKRSLTSPFAWLSRGSSEKKSPPSSKETSRRGTNASVATVGSNHDIMENGHEGSNGSGSARSSRHSLKDRFKYARMREEAGIAIDEEGEVDLVPPKNSLTAGRSLSVSVPGEKEEEAPPMTRVASSPGAPTHQPTINPNLAPGTAAGTAIGPDDDSAPPVDWDLWQSVVYEGPAAVARTSAEELNQAIASGIPQPIRGVVWQVLAQSKNEDLEVVYKDLVARGTDKEKVLSNVPQLPRNDSSEDIHKKKESVTSSASSQHSDYSTPATTTTGGTANGVNGMSSPTQNGTHDPHMSAKMLEERKKKQKEDASALVKLEKQIKRDLGARTSYSKYLMAAGLQDGLFNLCKAYALFDAEVGYPQGVNFIAMPLLFNMPEEEAFCLLVRLMNKYGLRDLFVHDMPGLHLHLYQFERLLEEFEPALYCHLHRRGVSPQLYATQWFLTLFAYRFPLQLVLRIYDLILSEGLESAILKFGIVLMQRNSQTLLEMKDMSHLTTFLKERLFDVYIDKAPTQSSLLESGFFGSAGGVDKEVYRADKLVQDACSVKITPEMLQAYAAEWREKQRIEKEREAEIEGLKATVHSLTSKVRNLEERTEKSDTEHVALASELVRTKVENERLTDENESMKGQVEELRKLVDLQGQEVEDRMNEQLHVAMRRNSEVQTANRALEEQLAEAEKELVETKLQWAQINADHETLRQKWSNVQNMLNS
ncbi:gtpase activating protein [Diplodia corticola]|uniref:GTPase-activating protein GYP5 n=1 Tax=Diplodia corticola TaxID=236234 RepID=A0A1J9RL83_9PEZI|nr:gtpase activating protein [Diplodia corticola]OJD33339.1 gtpase activating protein [Diplodia corticola]